MDKHSAAVLIFTSLLATCFGQLEMGGLLEGMGGLALLSAGGGLGAGTGMGITNAASSSNKGASGAPGTGGSGNGITSPGMDSGIPNMNPLLLASLMDLELGGAGMMGMGGQGMGGMGMGGMGMGGMGMGGGAGMGAGMGGGIARQIGPMVRMLTTMAGELGPGGIGRMIRGMITPMIASKMVKSKMNEVVKIVVGPHARPSKAMMTYAMNEMKPPSSPKDLFAYMNMMLEIAQKQGMFMPDGTIHKPASADGKGKKTDPKIEEIRDLIIKRSIMWFKSQKPPGPKKGGPPKGNGMM